MTDCRPGPAPTAQPSASEGSGPSLCFGADGERRPSRERGANLEEGMAARRGVDRGRDKRLAWVRAQGMGGGSEEGREDEGDIVSVHCHFW